MGYHFVDIRMLHLPAFGPDGVDLDDYLQGGWLELIPPIPWVFHVYSEVGTTDIDQYDPDPDDSWITHLACSRDMQISSRATDVGQTAAAMPQNRRGASNTPDRDYPPFEDPTPEVPTDGSIDSRADLPPAIRWIDKAHIPASAGSNHAARDDPYSRIGYDNNDPATKGRERKWMREHFDNVLSPGEEAGTWTPTRDPTDEIPRALPVADWFGMVPAIDAKYHPAASPDIAAVPGVSVPDQLTETADLSGVSEQSDLYDLEFRDVCRKSVGYRGPNPWGDYGDSSDYFVVLRHDGKVGGYDHKSKTWYNWLTALLVASGARRPSSSTLDKNPSDDEILQIWAYAKDKGLIPDDGENGKIPTRALTAYAKRHGIIDGPSDLEEVTIEGGGGDTNSFIGLSDEAYNRAITHFRENQSIDPVLTPRSGSSGNTTTGEKVDSPDTITSDSSDSRQSGSPSTTTTPDDSANDSLSEAHMNIELSGNPDDEELLSKFAESYLDVNDEEQDPDSNQQLAVRSEVVRKLYNYWAVEHGGKELSKAWFTRESKLLGVLPEHVNTKDMYSEEESDTVAHLAPVSLSSKGKRLKEQL